jgi:16S rRNA (cytidine1402-2'-O)-methyltransferase
MVLAVLLSGKSVALLSDSGTPAISDPGEELVNAAGLKGIKIVPIPGPCAAVAALSVSGMAAGQFCFEGFLPRQEKERRTRLGELAKEKRTLIFYEAPHRLLQTLQDLQLALGDREVFVAREMTKKFEELYRARLSRTLAHYRAQPPKGELVIVVAGVPEGALAENRENFTLDKLLTVLTRAGFSKKETAKIAAQCTGGSKNQIYKQLLEC